MVIAQNTEMILLDEPTTYMDIESQKLFFEIVRTLADMGRGIVMTCHDIAQSFSVSDIIVLMDQGAVRKTGTPDSLEKFRDDLVQLLGAAVKQIDDEKLMYPYVLIR
jgi:iron complex transport system ATP-binding protein